MGWCIVLHDNDFTPKCTVLLFIPWHEMGSQELHMFCTGHFDTLGHPKGSYQLIAMIPAQNITLRPPCWRHSLVGTWWSSTNHPELHPSQPSSVVWHSLINKTVWKCAFMYFWAHCNLFSLWALVKGGRNTAVCTSANLWRVLHREAPLASNTCLIIVSGFFKLLS